MRFFLLSVIAATAIVLATGRAVPGTGDSATAATAESPQTGVMPAGPLFGPLTPEEVGVSPVAVPEPVWASVLAACALSLLRRGRRY